MTTMTDIIIITNVKEMSKYFILINLFFTLKTLAFSNNVDFNTIKRVNRYILEIKIATGPNNLLLRQLCIIHKGNAFFCRRALSKMYWSNSVPETFFCSRNTSVLNRQHKNIPATSIQTFALKTQGNFEEASIFKNKNEYIRKHKCVPKLKRIIILNSFIYSPTVHVRKITRYRKSYGFHKIRKRKILNSDFEAKFNLINLVEGLNEQSTSNFNETMIGNDNKENKHQGEFMKSRIQKIIGENGHLTLNCPEVTLESKVEWYKNSEKLNSSFRNNMAETEKEPHLTIDAYNSLYLLQATKEEEGIYTCYVDGKPYQAYCVKIVSKSKLLNQEFFRYSIYLGFVLSLTITCYCAGICVAWHQRNYFADPLYLSLIC